MTVPRRLSGALALLVLLAGLALPAGAAAQDGTARASGFGAAIGWTAAAVEATTGANPEGSSAADGVGSAAGRIGRVQVDVSTTQDGRRASAEATASARDVQLLDGRIVASDLRLVVRASSDADGDTAGIVDYAIGGLTVDGQPVAVGPGASVEVAGVGTVSILESVADGTASVRANALRVTISDPASGLPVGSEIVVGHVEASAEAGREPEVAPEPAPAGTAPTGTAPILTAPTGPTRTAPTPTAPSDTAPTEPLPTPDPTIEPPAPEPAAPQRRTTEPGPPERTRSSARPPPPVVDPPSPPVEPPPPAPQPPPSTSTALSPMPLPLGLPRRQPPAEILPTTSAGYVFPVYGDLVNYTDDYGAPRAVTGWHQGNDIFAARGTPVLAVADGTLSRVGVNALGGNRLWLTDERGNTFYYAHLSAYAPIAVNGAQVRAGEVIAFVGNTGQAIATPPHLHFEIHPADGDSVDPYPYLLAWQRDSDVPLAFRAAELADGQAPAAGVLLVDMTPSVDEDAAPDDDGAEAVR